MRQVQYQCKNTALIPTAMKIDKGNSESFLNEEMHLVPVYTVDQYTESMAPAHLHVLGIPDPYCDSAVTSRAL